MRKLSLLGLGAGLLMGLTVTAQSAFANTANGVEIRSSTMSTSRTPGETR